MARMEALEAIDRLDDHIHEARPIPLTDQVRMDRSVLLADLDAIRRDLDQLRTVSAVNEAIEALETLAAAAKPLFGSDQVRFDREDFYDQLDALRAAVPEALDRGDRPPSPWDPVFEAIDSIQALLHTAPRTPFSRALKIDAEELRHAVGRLRTAAIQNVGVSVPEFSAALDELDELARRGGTLKLRYDELYDPLERLLRAAVQRA
jgi:hypothetical protein